MREKDDEKEDSAFSSSPSSPLLHQTAPVDLLFPGLRIRLYFCKNVRYSLFKRHLGPQLSQLCCLRRYVHSLARGMKSSRSSFQPETNHLWAPSHGALTPYFSAAVFCGREELTGNPSIYLFFNISELEACFHDSQINSKISLKSKMGVTWGISVSAGSFLAIVSET